MHVRHAIETRRSHRSFLPKAIPDDVLDDLLSAAISAPSASNKQPWRFFVVTGRPTLDAMEAAVKSAVARIRAHVPDESRDAFDAYGSYFTRFVGAPAVVAFACRGAPVLSHLARGLDADDARRVERMERDSAVVSTSLALQNFLLSAHARGLGASAMTGPLVADDALCGLLGIPSTWTLLAIVPIGYPADDPPPPARKALAAVVRRVR